MTRLILTVDTEVCVYDRALDNPDTQIWGRTLAPSPRLPDRNDYGIGFIMDELAARGWRCTFFLNVYDTDVWGEPAVADVARAIATRGFDVQLHTHVGGRTGLAGLAFDEQRRLIREGCGRIERWTGRRPAWHRAGNLCASRESLRACAAEGLSGDSSFLFGWPQCAELVQSPWSDGTGTRNALCWQEGILELPITTFRTLPGLRAARHLDVNACTYRELVSVIRQAVGADLPYVVLLMHSFSFVRRTASGYVPDTETIAVFLRFLDRVKALEGLEVAPVGAVAAGQALSVSQRPVCRDLYSGLLLTYDRAWRHWGRGWKHKVFALAPVVVATVALLIGLWMALQMGVRR